MNRYSKIKETGRHDKKMTTHDSPNFRSPLELMLYEYKNQRLRHDINNTTETFMSFYDLDLFALVIS